MLQYVAVCCSVLQCVAAWCSVLQCVAHSPRLARQNVNLRIHVAVYWIFCCVLQCVAVCCSMLQCVAVCCSLVQCSAVCCTFATTCETKRESTYSCCSLLNLLLCVAVCCSVLQRVAAYCSILQCAVVCCTFAVIWETRRNSTRFMLQCAAVYCSVLQRVAAWCIVLQCLAHWQRLRDKKSNYQAASTVCCSALQYSTVCCSVLQCIAVSYIFAASCETTSATHRFVNATPLVLNKYTYIWIYYTCVYIRVYMRIRIIHTYSNAHKTYLYTRVLFSFFKSWTSPAITPGVWPHPQINGIQITS